MENTSGQVSIQFPAQAEYSLVAAMAVSALGVLAGLDMDLLQDLRTACAECMDSILHLSGSPEYVCVKQS